MLLTIDLSKNSPNPNEDRILRIELIGDWREQEENFIRGVANLIAATTVFRKPNFIPFVSSMLLEVSNGFYKLIEDIEEKE